MIFVTLGSQKFQFNRLLQAIDRQIESGKITEPVFAQTGWSDYKPVHYEWAPFLDREDMDAWVAKADVVIAHGGTGAIVGALKAGKKVIAVPRLAKYGEHVDDHQEQITGQFLGLNMILRCEDCGELSQMIAQAKAQTFRPYVSHTQAILDSLEEFLQENFGNQYNPEPKNRNTRKISWPITRKPKTPCETR